MFYSRGGKPINSGGYGCVFKPALKCQGDQKRNDGISKLMTQEHAESEYQIIMRFADKIRQIPNAQHECAQCFKIAPSGFPPWSSAWPPLSSPQWSCLWLWLCPLSSSSSLLPSPKLPSSPSSSLSSSLCSS